MSESKKKSHKISKAAAVAAFCGMLVGTTTLVGCGESAVKSSAGTPTGDKSSCKGKDGCGAATTTKTTAPATTPPATTK